MRHIAVSLIGCFVLVSLCNAAIVQRRTYRNTEEILVPVAIIQDGEEISRPADVKENIIEAQINNSEPAAIAQDIAAAVDKEEKFEAVEAAAQAADVAAAVDKEEKFEAVEAAAQAADVAAAVDKEEKFEAVEAAAQAADVAAAVDKEEKLEAVADAVEAERRIDEAVIEEEIKEAVQEEQNKEVVQAFEEENKLSEIPEIVSVIQPEPEYSEAPRDPVQEVQQNEKLVVAEPANSNDADENSAAEEPAGVVRQATQASPTQTTAPPNVVQQFIQNSPLGQFFNPQNGSASAPFPTFPSLPTLPTFDPVAAANQAIQGFQQFTTNLGNQFQNPFAALAGGGGQQQQDAAAGAVTTARPPGPIQQFVNSFTQPTAAQPGPLQNFLNLFQGNRPQQSAAATSPQPAKEPEVVEQTPAESTAAAAAAAATSVEQESNAVRDSGEAVDSFEESVQPNELIVVNDDASETESDQAPEAVVVSN